MKNILLLSIVISSLVSFGQEYHKLINESYYWDVPYADQGYICNGFGDSGPFRYKFAGDTVINNITYSKIYYSSFINLNAPPAPNCPPFAVDTIFSLLEYCFLREDTVEKKVWRYMNINTPEEILLFDFSVEQGDTIEYEGLSDVIIDTIYNIITYDGKTRKIFEFGGIGFPGGFFIEGIGGAGGLIEVPYYYFEAGTWLLCVKDNNSNTIWDNYSNCYEFITNVQSIENKPLVKVFPNPFTKCINIENSTEIINVKIYNLLGKELLNETIIESKTIDMSSLNPGVFILKILKDQNEVITKKIIKTNGL